MIYAESPEITYNPLALAHFPGIYQDYLVVEEDQR
jgi:hypothetical protein